MSTFSTVSPTTTIHDVITLDREEKLTETIYNASVLKQLMEIDTTHPDYDETIHLWPSEISKIEKIFKHGKYNAKDDTLVLPQVYAQKTYERYDGGRKYLKKDRAGFQNLYKPLRILGMNGKYVSIDAVNCHPRLLYDLCAKHCGYISIELSMYINNRDRIIDELAQHYNTKRGNIKNLIIRLTNGGSHEKWRIENNITCERHHDTVIDMKKEIENIKNRYFLMFPRYEETLLAFAKHEKQHKGDTLFYSAISMYLQTEEHTVMSVMRKHLKLNYGITASALIHDAVCFHIDETNRDKFTPELLNEMKTTVKQTVGYDVEFGYENTEYTNEHKEYIQSHFKFIKNPLEIVDRDQAVPGLEYEDVKREFEKEVFKIKYAAEFGIEPTNNTSTLVRKNQKDLSIVYQELTYHGDAFFNIKTNTMERPEVDFVPRWLKDKEKRMYDAIDFLPKPLACPEYIYNTWNGFEIEKWTADEEDTESEANCDAIFQLVRVLCNHDEECYEYVMDWLAQMIQEPAIKRGTAIVFKSKQGAGKGTLVEIMRRIMGNAYVGETTNPAEDIFGSFGNAHIGKILLSLDEVKASDTNKVLGRLKNLITSERCMYNEKHAKQIEVTNCCRFMFTTNESIPISLDGKDDRRYCLIECSNEYCKKSDFWKEFYTTTVNNKAVLRAFYDFLNTRDHSGRDWMVFPNTELRNDIIQASLHPIIFFMDRFIQRGDHNSQMKFTAATLFEEYKLDCVAHGINCGGNSKAFGIKLKDVLPFDECGITKGRSKTAMFYKIDRDIMYKWLSTNDYTSYETPPSSTLMMVDDL